MRNLCVTAAALIVLAGCMARQPVPAPAPTGITSSRGGGDQSVGNVGVSGPLRTTRTQ